MKPFIQKITEGFANAVAEGIGRQHIRMRQRWRPNGVYRTPRYPYMLPITMFGATLQPNPKLTMNEANWNNVPRYRRQWKTRKYHNDTPYKRPAHKIKPRFVFEL